MFKNRIELAQHFATLGFTKGVEVGVCTGRYSKILLESIPGLKLIGVDPYLPGDQGGSFRHQETHDVNYQKAHELLIDYPSYVLMVGYSSDVAPLIADGSLDFVFIDGVHDYKNVKTDIEAWAPKVRKGGIVSGHDYYMGKRLTHPMGVIKAVDEYVAKHGYELQTTEWDPDAFRDDRQPDWWFVK